MDWTDIFSFHWLSHLWYLNRMEQIFPVLTDCFICGMWITDSFTCNNWTGQNWHFQFSLTLSPVVAKPDRADSSQWPSHLRFIGVLVSVPGPLNAGWLGKWAVPRLITFYLTCTGFLCHASFLRRSFSTWWFLSAGSLRSWCWCRLWNMESKKSGF